MSTQDGIRALEERLRQAELGANPEVFEELLADDAILVDQEGHAARAKRKVVEAHRRAKAPSSPRGNERPADRRPWPARSSSCACG
jgi:hypothetical protein